MQAKKRNTIIYNFKHPEKTGKFRIELTQMNCTKSDQLVRFYSVIFLIKENTQPGANACKCNGISKSLLYWHICCLILKYLSDFFLENNLKNIAKLVG